MKPEDLFAYKKLTEHLSSRELLVRRFAEEQIKADSSRNRLIAESMKGIRASAAMEMARQLSAVDNWTQAFEFQARNQVESLIRKMSQSAFNVEQFAARHTVTEQIKSLTRFHAAINAEKIANLGRLNPPERVASLSVVFEQRLKTLEQFHSGFAQTMAQTLKTAFEGLEESNQESLAKLEKSLGDKIEAIPDKFKDPVWVKVLKTLYNLVMIAGVVIALAQYLEPKEQSQALTAFITEATKTLQKAATEKPETYYEAQRIVRLKLEPDNGSATLAIIPKGDEVLLVYRKHKWIFVAYTDDSGTTWGWVNKKYLEKSD